MWMIACLMVILNVPCGFGVHFPVPHRRGLHGAERTARGVRAAATRRRLRAAPPGTAVRCSDLLTSGCGSASPGPWAVLPLAVPPQARLVPSQPPALGMDVCSQKVASVGLLHGVRQQADSPPAGATAHRAAAGCRRPVVCHRLLHRLFGSRASGNCLPARAPSGPLPSRLCRGRLHNSSSSQIIGTRTCA